MNNKKMVYVLKNFKNTGGYYEEFAIIKIKDDEDVFVDLPICLCEYGKIYKEPVLVSVDESQNLYCFEKKELMDRLKDTRQFFIKVLDNKDLVEVKQGEHDFVIRMLKSEDISNYTINENNKIIKKEAIENE